MSTVQNHDIAGFIRRSRRFKYEWAKSQSGNASAVSEADAQRLRSYLDGLRAYKQWFQSQPILDLPESHGGRVIELGEGEALAMPENEAVVDIMQLWDLLEIELLSSQSARLAARLIGPDETRVDSLLDKMQRFLDDYISRALPLDLPESSPLRQGVGAGRRGINPGA